MKENLLLLIKNIKNKCNLNSSLYERKANKRESKIVKNVNYKILKLKNYNLAESKYRKNLEFIEI